MPDFDYQPYYCEENVWRLCRRAPQGDASLYAVFISNALGAVPLWSQRAAQSAGKPVFWDYHVVAVSRDGGEARTWDLDSRLSVPVGFERWWAQTFPLMEALRRELQPRFRLLPAEEFLETFSSDRSHMLDDDGAWRHPPPPWERIYDAEEGMNLREFTEMSDERRGSLFDPAAFREYFLR